MNRPIRIALTLIELIVALVLASLLTTALLQIVGTVVRETEQMRGERIDDVSAGILADRLRTDLINARGMLFDSQSLQLAGFVGEQQLPGSIRYRQRRIANQSVLIRETSGGAEVCWVGFGGFVIRPEDEIDAETETSDVAAGLPPMPRLLRVGVFDAAGRSIISEVITHHES